MFIFQVIPKERKQAIKPEEPRHMLGDLSKIVPVKLPNSLTKKQASD